MKIDDVTIEFLHECFLLDETSGVLTWKIRPASHFPCEANATATNKRLAGTRAGTFKQNKNRYIVHFGGKYFMLHRIVFAISKGIDLKQVPQIVDHIDGDASNNSPGNLRGASYRESCANRGMLKNNTSGFKGVKFIPKIASWTSRIQSHGKSIHLGTFRTKEEAGAAYHAAAKILHGEFFRATFQSADAAA